MSRTNKTHKSRRGEEGAVVVLLVLFLLLLFLLTFLIFSGQNGVQASMATIKTLQSVGDDDSQVTNSNPKTVSSSNTSDISISENDLIEGHLVCCKLSGVNYPRTPALDNRVARRLNAVLKELESLGIQISFTWGFRSTCQQVNVIPTGSLKARPGQSPHEAGRAVDVRGMTTRSDAPTIVRVFRNHGFVWLGPKDPPHFEVKGYTIGVASHHDMIVEAQKQFKQGFPKDCHGSECGQ